MAAIIILGVVFIIFWSIFHRIMKIREIEQENQLLQSYMDAIQEFYLGIQEGIEATSIE